MITSLDRATRICLNRWFHLIHIVNLYLFILRCAADSLLFGLIVTFFEVFLKLGLHVSNCFSVNLTLNCRCSFDDIKIFEEFVEANHTFLEVLQANRSIIVEIKSHPAILVDRNVNVRVSISHVGAYLILLGRYHINESCDLIDHRVVKKEHMVEDGAELVVDVNVQTLAMPANQIKLVIDIHACVQTFIQWQAFYLINSLATIIHTNIKQLETNLLELIQILFISLIKLYPIN